jgi:FkbH-like protein
METKDASLSKNPGISDYFNLYKKISSGIKKIKPSEQKKVKIALLSSFTIKGIKEILSVKCYNLGIISEFYIGEYNQYSQEILDKNSGFYKFNPDIVILFIDTMAILGEQYFLPYQTDDKHRLESVNKKSKEIISLVDKIKEKLSSKIIVHNLEVPSHSPLGILENKQEFGFIESVEKLNENLRDALKADSQAFVFDYNSFCSRAGNKGMMDYKMYYLGDMKISLDIMPELCDEYLAYIKPLMSLTKKCIVLDLDNTLWGGVLGEDGLEGIKLGPTPEGRPFLELQKYLLSLFNRGIILAINSKNNFDDVKEVFKKHPYMVLKEDNFAEMQINWNDKVTNIKAIAEELNIGTDSLVFIDDDKANREMVKEALPEVLVIDLPEDPALYPTTLMGINDFNTFSITDEDKNKGMMYSGQRKRKELEKTATDITEYLKGLEMVVTIEKANTFNIPRIAQLTQKTNQFNMTTKRYQEEDIKKFSKDKNFIVLSIKVEDKFGDNGITGAALVRKAKDQWEIDTFLLSCRVIGRKVEETLLAYIIGKAKKEKAKLLTGEFIPTKKNIPGKDFYKNNNFSFLRKEGEKEFWAYDLKKGYVQPKFIKVIESGDRS